MCNHFTLQLKTPKFKSTVAQCTRCYFIFADDLRQISGFHPPIKLDSHYLIEIYGHQVLKSHF